MNDKCYVISNSEGKVWTRQARWGNVPQLYPSIGRVKQVIRYHYFDYPDYEFKEESIYISEFKLTRIYRKSLKEFEAETKTN